MQRSFNTFFRFVLGFTVFVATSLGLTVVASNYAVQQERKEQAAAALKALLGEESGPVWWEMWK